MFLKRRYDSDSNVIGVKVIHAGPEQHFSPRLVMGACGQGWMELNNSQIIIKGDDGLVVYNIRRPPGKYENETINYYDCVRVS